MPLHPCPPPPEQQRSRRPLLYEWETLPAHHVAASARVVQPPPPHLLSPLSPSHLSPEPTSSFNVQRKTDMTTLKKRARRYL